MKKYLALVLSILLMFTIVACENVNLKPEITEDIEGEKIEDGVEDGDNNTGTDYNETDENKHQADEQNHQSVEHEAKEPQEAEDIVEPTPETIEKEVTLYFANKDYIDTGDEELKKLIPEKRTIEFDGISLEEAIVNELIDGTEDLNLTTVIPSTIELINVEVVDKTAFVNFSQEGLFGGSMQETFTISQIVKSLIELDTVDKVQFLVDGKKVESLMGHFDISKPFEGPIY